MTDTAQAEPLVVLPIDAVIPYWRNPRTVDNRAVAKLMASIERYGYQNPIIVDADHVIIAGHTRYLAVRRLGWDQVPVLVADLPHHLAREYRIVDNRSGEWTTWDMRRLVNEIARFTERDVLATYFPELDLTGDLTQHEMDVADLDLGLPDLPPRTQAAKPSKLVICTHCFHEFDLPDEEEAPDA